MTDKEFDRFLEETIDVPPPVDLAEEFTPWRSAMNRILWGTGWTTLTLNFWGLDIILPAIGWMMLLLGYRALRKENKWFFLGYVISWLRILCWLMTFAVHSTIYGCEPRIKDLLTSGSYAMVIPGFLGLLALRNGIRAVQKKAGLPPHGGTGMLVWYVIIVFLALYQLQGFLALVLMILYVFLLMDLNTLSRELDQAGYVVSPAPVRISDTAVKWIYAGAIVLLLFVGFCFFGSYLMDWQPVTVSAHSEVQAVRQDLLELGFPEHILDDLTQEDLLSCKGALRIVTEVNDHPINDGREVAQQYQEGNDTHTVYSTVYDQKELRLTCIALELPGAVEQWKIIHHFQWVIDPGFRGTEVIQLWPAYRYSDGWVPSGSPSGQVLYTKGHQTYAAPYYSLEAQIYASRNIFLREQNTTDVFAAFSMPGGVENHRGYVSYTVSEIEDGHSINAWLNYAHQTSRLQFPVRTAREYLMTSGLWDSIQFITVQDALQFYPSQLDME